VGRQKKGLYRKAEKGITERPHRSKSFGGEKARMNKLDRNFEISVD
jgi:hypothetical protein